MSRIKIQGPPGAAGVVWLGRPEDNECLDHGCEFGMGGDERGQDAGPPVHAVRVRDVLQLDGLGALPTCRIEDVTPRHNYARSWMSPAIAAIVSSASSLT